MASKDELQLRVAELERKVAFMMKELGLTRRCCALLLEHGFGLYVLTKSPLVLRDLDLFAKRPVTLGVTITTLDETLRKQWEPRAGRVRDRLRILSEARAAGIETSVMFGPLLPGFSDTRQALDELFRCAADLKVDTISVDALNPRPRVWPSQRIRPPALPMPS